MICPSCHRRPLPFNAWIWYKRLRFDCPHCGEPLRAPWTYLITMPAAIGVIVGGYWLISLLAEVIPIRNASAHVWIHVLVVAPLYAYLYLVWRWGSFVSRRPRNPFSHRSDA